MTASPVWRWSLRGAPDIDWLEPGFAIGSRPDAAQREPVRSLGIDRIVAVHHPNPDEHPSWLDLGVEYLSFPTEDWVEIPPEQFTRVVEAVHQAHLAGRSVLLHCIAGVNRAPTFAAAVLCYRYGLTIEQAVGKIRGVRPSIAPTEAQLTSLYAWLRTPGLGD